MRALGSELGLILIALGAIGCGGDEGTADAGPSPMMDARVVPRVDTGPPPVPVDSGNVPGDDGGPPGFDAGPPQPCEAAGTIETVSCGRCGSVERFCTAAGVWAYGDCEGQGGCEPGTMSEVTCGDCGTQMARCTSTCEWEPTEECSDEGECTPGTRTRNGLGCDPGETREVACTDACVLAPAGDCESDECGSPGALEDVSCGSCGTQTRFCTVDGVWEYGLCEGEPEDACVPGTIEPMECGMCGSRMRRCLAGCTWDESASCTGEGECAPGATTRSSDGCDPGETKLLRCTDACAFVEEEPCSDTTSPLDVMILLDMTGSHATRVQSNEATLEDRLIAPLLALGDVAVGVSYFADFAGSDDTGGWPLPFDAGFPLGGGDAGAGPGSPGDRPFHGGIAPSLSRSAIVAELGAAPTYHGGDGPESGVEALFILAGGTPHEAAIPLSCPSGRTSGGCWRSGSARVILIYSDAAFHNGPDPDTTGVYDPYWSGLGAASWSSARSRLLADGTRLIFVHEPLGGDAGPQYEEMLEALGQPASDRIATTAGLGPACDAAVARIESLGGL